MNPNKALWEKGDFTRIAEGMRESGEALVADIGIEPGIHQPGNHQPDDSGVESEVTERFTAAGIPKENISFQRDTYRSTIRSDPPALSAPFAPTMGRP